MIEFTPLRNVSNKGLQISIDTLTSSVYKNTLKNYSNKKGFSIEKIKSHSRVSANIKRKLFDREYTSCRQIKTPHFQNIIYATPSTLNKQSNYKKANLIAYGLSNPNKPLHVKAKEDITNLFNRFRVETFDLAINCTNPIEISRLKPFGGFTWCYDTIYINEPLQCNYITKIKSYDKQKKDRLPYPLYRLELTIKTQGKLNDMFIPHDEIETIINSVF